MGLSGLLWFYFNTFVFHINVQLKNYNKALPVSALMQKFPPSRFMFLSDALTFVDLEQPLLHNYMKSHS